MNWLTLPLHEPFMQKALIAVVLVGATCSVLGAYVVLRRMAFIGDAISHTTLPGIVVGFLCGINLFVGALVAALVTALGIGWLSRREAIREDTAIGVIFTGMFALGVMIVMKTRLYRDFSSILFGDILAVTGPGLILIAVIAVLVLAIMALFHKELELTSVDPNYAATVGLRADWMQLRS
jgi:ABC-type Mn2+/Zn2+ transport system permease subunit